ncbi:MAG: hypothetical protein RIT45_1521, partial [Pseudomonadota bacterium]
MSSDNDKPGPVPAPPPQGHAQLPSRLRGEQRRTRDKTQFGVSAEGGNEADHRPTVPQFGATGSSHRHHDTLSYAADDEAAVPSQPGVGLDELLARGPREGDDAIARIKGIAAALEERHAKGFGHGGLTPHHVRYVPDDSGELVLVDMADAKVSELYEARYEAPELSGALQTRTVQPTRADVYALGAIFFEMVCGRPLYEAPSAKELRQKHARAAVPGARQANPDADLPPSVELVMQKALKKRPGDRHPDAAAFIADLISANADDDRGTVHLSVEEAGFLKDILEAKTQSERTKQEVEEEKRRVEEEKRRAAAEA